jgi:hypothetical protein
VKLQNLPSGWGPLERKDRREPWGNLGELDVDASMSTGPGTLKKPCWEKLRRSGVELGSIPSANVFDLMPFNDVIKQLFNQDYVC